MTLNCEKKKKKSLKQIFHPCLQKFTVLVTFYWMTERKKERKKDIDIESREKPLNNGKPDVMLRK